MYRSLWRFCGAPAPDEGQRRLDPSAPHSIKERRWTPPARRMQGLSTTVSLSSPSTRASLCASSSPPPAFPGRVPSVAFPFPYPAENGPPDHPVAGRGCRVVRTSLWPSNPWMVRMSYLAWRRLGGMGGGRAAAHKPRLFTRWYRPALRRGEGGQE